MKYMFASDIHGSAWYCRRLLEEYRRSGADRLILLGDLLYHGPRNDLPREYAPKEVISMLNTCKDEIYAVRGNCEAEVDQMVLEFPVMADYALLMLNGLTFYATHGVSNGGRTRSVRRKFSSKRRIGTVNCSTIYWRFAAPKPIFAWPATWRNRISTSVRNESRSGKKAGRLSSKSVPPSSSFSNIRGQNHLSASSSSSSSGHFSSTRIRYRIG